MLPRTGDVHTLRVALYPMFSALKQNYAVFLILCDFIMVSVYPCLMLVFYKIVYSKENYMA